MAGDIPDCKQRKVSLQNLIERKGNELSSRNENRSNHRNAGGRKGYTVSV